MSFRVHKHGHMAAKMGKMIEIKRMTLPEGKRLSAIPQVNVNNGEDARKSATADTRDALVTMGFYFCMRRIYVTF